jgi:tight adherence protein C
MTAGSLAAVSAFIVVVTICRPRHVSRTFPAARTSTDSARRLRVPRWARSHSRVSAIEQAMPELLDLVVITLQAGLPASMVFTSIRLHVPRVITPAVDDVVSRCQRGERFVDSLGSLIEHLGTCSLGLVAAITTAERSGLPLAPTVDRLAEDARAHRRRAAEIEARRLPVRLSIPLVCCTLPSFVCIAIGPVLVGALSSLRSV